MALRRRSRVIGWALGAGADVLEVTEAVLAKLASKENPQAMLGVFRQRWVNRSLAMSRGQLGAMAPTMSAISDRQRLRMERSSGNFCGR